MAYKNRDELKAYLETADTPTQTEFADLIDSLGGLKIAEGNIAAGGTFDLDFAAATPKFKKIRLFIQSLILSNSGSDLNMRLSNDGTTFITVNNYIWIRTNAVVFVNPGTATSSGGGTPGPEDKIILYPNVDIGAGKYIKGIMDFDDPDNNTILPTVDVISVSGWQAGVGRSRHTLAAHHETAVGRVRGVRLYPSAGTIVSGKYMLKGY